MNLKGIKMTEEEVFAAAMAEVSTEMALAMSEKEPAVWSKISIGYLISAVSNGMLSGHLSTLSLSEKITEQKAQKMRKLLTKALNHTLKAVRDMERASSATKEGGNA